MWIPINLFLPLIAEFFVIDVLANNRYMRLIIVEIIFAKIKKKWSDWMNSLIIRRIDLLMIANCCWKNDNSFLLCFFVGLRFLRLENIKVIARYGAKCWSLIYQFTNLQKCFKLLVWKCIKSSDRASLTTYEECDVFFLAQWSWASTSASSPHNLLWSIPFLPVKPILSLFKSMITLLFSWKRPSSWKIIPVILSSWPLISGLPFWFCDTILHSSKV